MRFFDLIPNTTWFHNHSQIPKSTKTHHHHKPTSTNHPTPLLSTAAGDPELHAEPPFSLSPPRKSYHFTRNLINPKSPELMKSSSTTRIKRKPTTHKSTPSEKYSSNSGISRANSVINDDRSCFLGRRKTGESASSVSSAELRPIKTERNLVKKIGGPREAIDEQKRSSSKSRGRRANGSFSVKVVKEESSIVSSVSSFKEQGNRFVRRSPNGSPRVRIRIHSPRIARRAQVHSSRSSLPISPSKKGVSSKSLAVVKSSSDPQRDFRESMVEMIVENNIRSSKDLEELLACYLSLNSDQYHDVIIEAFTQIWFDLNNIMKEIKK